MAIDARRRLIVALDVSTDTEAKKLVTELDGVVSFFKVSHQLYSNAGPDIIHTLAHRKKSVFLDFKYHDIYESVKSAVAQMAPHVKFLTLHGNGETIRGARDGRGNHDLKLLAFTALSSFDQLDIKEIYNFSGTVQEFMVQQALKAAKAGVDGVIASGQEVKAVRDVLPRPFLIVTPGVRMKGGSIDDHKRTLTPGGAVAAGSDYVVVGRPITAAADPRAVASEFVEQMQEEFDKRPD